MNDVNNPNNTIAGDVAEGGVSFEAAIARLEEIVRMLESGSAPLDKSLAMFEEGVSLVKLCNTKLDKAEQKVKILTRSENGEMTESDMK